RSLIRRHHTFRLFYAVSETTMKASRKNRPTRSAAPQPRPTTPRTGATIPEKGETHPTLIWLRCPNPGCGKTYTVPHSFASKNARCSCGALFPISTARVQPPGSAAPKVSKQPHTTLARATPANKTKLVSREETAARQGPDATEVHVGC